MTSPRRFLGSGWRPARQLLTTPGGPSVRGSLSKRRSSSATPTCATNLPPRSAFNSARRGSPRASAHSRALGSTANRISPKQPVPEPVERGDHLPSQLQSGPGRLADHSESDSRALDDGCPELRMCRLGLCLCRLRAVLSSGGTRGSHSPRDGRPDPPHDPGRGASRATGAGGGPLQGTRRHGPPTRKRAPKCQRVGPKGGEHSTPRECDLRVERVVEVVARGDSITVVPVGREVTTSRPQSS